MTDSTRPLPLALVEAAEQEGRTAWLATLPGTVARLARAWSLSVEAPFQPGGQTAWVAPVRDRAGAELVLKIGWAHPEAIDEADGLGVWSGHGAVRVHAAEQTHDTSALLLERCRPGTPLAARPEPEQDEVLAGLLGGLWVQPPAGHTFRPLQVMVDQWAEEFRQQLAAEPGLLDSGLAREGIALFQRLPSSADRQVLLATDAHAGNVLAAQREPWLLIDPKPYVGDPAYDALQHLLNCAERLHADPTALADRMAGLLEGVDRVRLRRWLFARCVLEAPGDPALADVALRIPID
ncbi:aminoglycoside phosphotransferase family protein [Blastococcus sp. CT_GayMR16]|uniref:aminoglycoside phosphotransferase family protein n=1 Tax=Blastococcus sp. CT_GayMR16 TaxID=2559607 RepID=UPI00143065B7|nr:aminoglycoside phosphotransferase family protein [Blastococcus sp. CT_GayMR16]